jgi:transcriptional repressor NrdR
MAVRRRRKCQDCRARFTTYERAHEGESMVLKRDGALERFNPQKVAAGIRKACAKRPVSKESIEEIVERVTEMVESAPEQVVASADIGQAVTGLLMETDEVAYVRWCSVYRDFRDMESFERALDDLREERVSTAMAEA